jgi:hypothetical protein
MSLSKPIAAPARINSAVPKPAECEPGAALVQKVATATLKWLALMPAHVRPTQLTRRHPRIANRLAELWRAPAQCAYYLETLQVDRRGGRQGFTPEVVREIDLLQRYFLAGCGK